MNEHSAGTIILKKDRNQWSVLLIRDMKGELTFPKGLIEDGETAVQAAIREAHEETGISVHHYVCPLGNVSYVYTRDGNTIHKTVEYFLFLYDGNDTLIPQREEGISQILWKPLTHAIDEIGYPKSNTQILLAAQANLPDTVSV